MKSLKNRNVLTFLIISTCALISFSCSEKEYPKDNFVKSELQELQKSIKKEFTFPLDEQMILETFKSDVTDLLSKWEHDAPDIVIEKIEILKLGKAIPSADAAEDIMKMGVYAKGACKELINSLGNPILIVPGDIPKIFGAENITAGKNAGNALFSMGEAAIPALILSLYLPFEKEEKEFTIYRKKNAQRTLQRLIGVNYGSDPMIWIKWYIKADINIVISEVEKSNKVQKKPIETTSTDYWDNDFLWVLLIGAAIVIFRKSKKKK